LARTKEELDKKVKEQIKEVKPKPISYSYYVNTGVQCIMYQYTREILKDFPEFSYTGVMKCLGGQRNKHKGFKVGKIKEPQKLNV